MFAAMWAILLGLSSISTHAVDRFQKPLLDLAQLIAESHEYMMDARPEVDSEIKAKLILAAASARSNPALEAVLSKRPALRLQLKQMLADLFYRFIPSKLDDRRARAASILYLLDSLQLWSRSQLWFLMDNLTSPTEVNTQAVRIAQIIPQLEIEDRRILAARLRKTRPLSLTALCLLYEAGQANKGELGRLLAIASRQFTKSLERGRDADHDEFRRYRMSQPYQTVVAKAVIDLQAGLTAKDPVLSATFDRVVSEVKRHQPLGYQGRDRLLFFVLLINNRLDWFDRASWVREAAATPNPDPPRLTPRYKAQGNLLIVNFGPKKKCEEQLD